jgi:hypothetical protein
MLDYSHLPKQQNGNIDYFPGFSNTDGGSWVVWEKPKGTHMIRITCIAGGGGGGTGYNGNPGTGGAGGGSSAISIVTIPAYVLPDVLYVSSGVGGNGGVAPSVNTATLGSNGIRSYVCIAQDTGAIYRVCYADSGKAGTTAATSTAGGSAGAGGTVATIADMLLASHGIRNFIGGQGGRFGAVSSGGIHSYPTTGLLLSGGTAGSGSGNSFGGVIGAPTQTAYTIFITPSGGVVGTDNTNSSGVEIYQPLLSCGGSSASGGNGGGAGAGGFGSGGAGSSAAISQPGGKGGNGLVIIHSW